MTVDHKPFSGPREQTDVVKEHIEKLREVTGVSDEKTLRNALDKGREATGEYNLNNAIDLIIGNYSNDERVVIGREDPEMSPVPSPAVVMNPPVAVAPPDKTKVVDLTEDATPKEDDLQRAIAMSLQEGGQVSTATSTGGTGPPGVSQEDQDVSRALEASLLESGVTGGRRKKDPQNPHDREREAQWPVGLKNVGQTCWFSSVIQCLFNIPSFRILVLNFTPPQQEPRTDRQRKILEFMLELRRLFALLVGSQRKYVDPSHAVGILRGTLGGDAQVQTYCNNQQDVSEFTHKLLDWLEEAFKQPGPDDTEYFGKEKKVEDSVDMDSEAEKCDKEKESECSNSSNSDKASKSQKCNNPMSDLFYGRVKIEGKNQGNEFSREDPFGQWPLQVNGYSDIHDSLEASTAHEYFDTSCTDLGQITSETAQVSSHPRKSGQERWFTKLPPVLFFELSRFQFNQQRGTAEKINNILEFPETIYMDRYLEENNNLTRSKREEVRKLKERRECLKAQLLTFTEFGSEPSQKYPLVNQIRNVLDFARSGSENVPSVGDDPSRDIDMASPGGATAMQVDSPCHSPASLTPASSMANLHQAVSPSSMANLQQVVSPSSMANLHQAVSPSPMANLQQTVLQVSPPRQIDESPPALKTLPDGSVNIPIVVVAGRSDGEGENAPTPMDVEDAGVVKAGESLVKVGEVGGARVPPPAPRHVSELELKVLSGCLSRWRQEAEEEIEYLNRSIAEIDKDISEMYNQPGLHQKAYMLHAVMVHEGDMNQGHYWSYVFNHEKKMWLKFNDNTVSETTLEELRRESFGGHCHTSAYSMVYIDVSRPDLLETPRFGVSVPSLAATTCTTVLPQDLENYLLEDNKAFAAEILRWDEEVKRKSEAKSPEAVLVGDDDECQIIETKQNLSTSHALLAKKITLEELEMIEATPADPSKSVHYKLINQLYQKTKNKIIEARVEGFGERSEPRLESLIHYLAANEESIPLYLDLVKIALLEQIYLPEVEQASSFGQECFRSAKDMLAKEKMRGGGKDVTLIKWHRCYHQFRIACNYFVLGVERYVERRVEEALELLTNSYIVNQKLQEDPQGATNLPNKMMNIRGLLKHFHLAVSAVNNKLVEEFETGSSPHDVTERVTRILVPAIHILQLRTNASSGGKDGSDYRTNASSGVKDASLLEDVRSRWCAMIENPLPDNKSEYWQTIFNIVIADDSTVHLRSPINQRYPSLADDLKLEAKYRTVMLRVMREDKG